MTRMNEWHGSSQTNSFAWPLTHVLCFLTRGKRVLMLHRNKAPNRGLWNGVGGRIEPGEAPLAACLREVREESGYVLSTARFAGLLTWQGFELPPGGLYLFTAPAPAGNPVSCEEGILRWQPRAWVLSSPQVVANIHIFGPAVLDGAPLQAYHFEYGNGQIVHHELKPLPGWLELG
ncbi:MAG: NUDIX domain-containing protein [Thermoflexales bacterium]|nr:NUDIX domain-containing protein [Thermoflexales bacterium]